MKTMDINGVIDSWLDGKTDIRNSTGSIFVDGLGVIYSYGYHHPIAKFAPGTWCLGSGTYVLWNPVYASRTTAKQKGMLKRKLRSRNYTLVPTCNPEFDDPKVALQDVHKCIVKMTTNINPCRVTTEHIELVKNGIHFLELACRTQHVRRFALKKVKVKLGQWVAASKDFKIKRKQTSEQLKLFFRGSRRFDPPSLSYRHFVYARIIEEITDDDGLGYKLELSNAEIYHVSKISLHRLVSELKAAAPNYENISGSLFNNYHIKQCGNGNIAIGCKRFSKASIRHFIKHFDAYIKTKRAIQRKQKASAGSPS